MPLSAPAPLGWRGFPVTHSAGTSCGHGAGAEGTQRGGSVFWGHSLREGGLDVPPPRQSQCSVKQTADHIWETCSSCRQPGLGPGNPVGCGAPPRPLPSDPPRPGPSHPAVEPRRLSRRMCFQPPNQKMLIKYKLQISEKQEEKAFFNHLKHYPLPIFQVQVTFY